jgi:hypothetical protein
MNEKDKLMELLFEAERWGDDDVYAESDILLANGVIVPPCKVGDIVWRIEDVWHLDDRETWTYHYEKEVLEFMVRSISISCNSKGVWTKKIRICQVIDGKTIDRQRNIEFDEIGKTVFLSREDAEKTLKEAQL